MRIFLAFFVAISFVTSTFAAETCVDVDFDLTSPRIGELLKQGYKVRTELERTERRKVELVGVGLGFYEDMIVTLVVPGSSAAEAGIPIGGEVVAVDGAPTRNSTKEEVVKAIRGKGKVGSVVHVSIRLTDGSIRGYTLTRKEVKTEEEVIVLRMCKPETAPSSPPK